MSQIHQRMMRAEGAQNARCGDDARRPNRIRVEPLSTAFGAEIGGVDLAAPLAEPTLADIRHAFGEYGVILFRDQHLTPEQHLVFAREP
jgi:alpha-ketoglutarate-dependent taurine dioxygenase